jgi:hypothetical protein
MLLVKKRTWNGNMILVWMVSSVWSAKYKY